MLLDTHIAVWTTVDPDALTEAERTRMSRPGVRLVLPAVAIWELKLKWDSFDASGKRKGPLEPASVMGFAKAVGWELHKDPFDELLLVQPQEEWIRLLTRDAKLVGHPCAVGGPD